MNEAVSREPLLRCQSLNHVYKEGELETQVLKGIDLCVAPGEMLAVVGSSGSGKTTLLHLMGALDNPSSGAVLFKGRISTIGTVAPRLAFATASWALSTSSTTCSPSSVRWKMRPCRC